MGEGTDEVFAERVIDPDLASDGAIDLRHHRGRNLHETHAPQIGRRGKADEIADHPPADGDNDRRSIRAHLDQRLVHAPDGDGVLEAFAVGNQDRLRFG